MRGIAVIDRQPGSSTAAVWVVSRGLGVAPLHVADLNALLSETAEHQARITDAVRTYKRDTRSMALTEPDFAPPPSQDQFTPSEDSPAQRSFALANFTGRMGPGSSRQTKNDAGEPFSPKRTTIG